VVDELPATVEPAREVPFVREQPNCAARPAPSGYRLGQVEETHGVIFVRSRHIAIFGAEEDLRARRGSHIVEVPEDHEPGVRLGRELRHCKVAKRRRFSIPLRRGGEHGKSSLALVRGGERRAPPGTRI
jgi:hypothetical protein